MRDIHNEHGGSLVFALTAEPVTPDFLEGGWSIVVAPEHEVVPGLRLTRRQVGSFIQRLKDQGSRFLSRQPAVIVTGYNDEENRTVISAGTLVGAVPAQRVRGFEVVKLEAQS